MNRLTSPLLWKIVGAYGVLSAVALAGLRASLKESHSLATSAAVAMWVCGVMCLIPIAMGLVSHLTRLRSSEKLLLRNDELGRVAREFSTLHQRVEALKFDASQVTEAQQAWSSLSVAVQAMRDGVITIDQDERIVFANNSACRLLNTTESSVVGRLLFEIVRSNHLEETVSETLTQRRTSAVEFRHPRTDEHLSVVASPIPSAGAVLLLADVSEMRKLESMRRDFVSGVSHELKTPLTVIQACTDTLLEGALDDREAANRFLHRIEDQSERLLALIVGMLQLAKLEAGQEVFQEEVVDLAEIARTVTSNFQPVAEAESVELSVAGAQELFVMADRRALRTVVENLVNNAIKYTPEGGDVRLELREDDDANVLLVSDTGIGIARELQDRVFERFYRVDRDRDRQSGGTGLGLAIVKHLSQAIGAELQLTSETGQGTQIAVRFPVNEM